SIGGPAPVHQFSPQSLRLVPVTDYERAGAACGTQDAFASPIPESREMREGRASSRLRRRGRRSGPGLWCCPVEPCAGAAPGAAGLALPALVPPRPAGRGGKPAVLVGPAAAGRRAGAALRRHLPVLRLARPGRPLPQPDGPGPPGRRPPGPAVVVAGGAVPG